MKEILLQRLFILGLFISILILFLLSNLYISNRVSVFNNNVSKNKISLLKENDFEQEFIYTGQNIYLVYVKLDNPGVRNRDGFVFSLKEDNKTLAQIPFAGANVKENDLVKFQFPIVNNVNNKKLNIVLHSESSDPLQAISIFTDQNGSLNYKAYEKGEFALILIQNLKEFLSKLTVDSGFIILYVFILIVTLYLYIKSVKYE